MDFVLIKVELQYDIGDTNCTTCIGIATSSKGDFPRQPMITQCGKTSAELKKNPRERLLLIPPKRKMELRLRLRQNHGQKRKG
jgi:hypothetical protein